MWKCYWYHQSDVNFYSNMYITRFMKLYRINLFSVVLDNKTKYWNSCYENNLESTILWKTLTL